MTTGIGLPARILRIEDVGRHRIIRAEVAGSQISVIVPEGQPVGADLTHVRFDPARVNVYADDWRVKGASA